MKIIDEMYQDDIDNATKIRNLAIGLSTFTTIIGTSSTISFILDEHTPIKLVIAIPVFLASGLGIKEIIKQQKELKQIEFVKQVVERETKGCFPEEIVKEERKEKFKVIK